MATGVVAFGTLLGTVPPFTGNNATMLLGFSDITLTDPILDEYIEDSQAFIEEFTRRTYIESLDADWPSCYC